MTYEAGELRNIVLTGHSDSGKTAFADAVAHLAGASPRKGQTADGTSIFDFEPEEKERKHSLASSIVHFSWKKKPFNLIDCPGYPDFLADTISAMSVAETAIVAVGGHHGVTFNTRSIWDRAGKAGVARAVLITKIDQENADFDALLRRVQECFGDRCVPALFPDGSGAKFTRVVDVLHIDPNLHGALHDRAISHYNSLVEHVVEADDKLMEEYLEKGSISREDFDKNFAKAMVAGKVVPVMVADPARGIGLQECLNLIEAYFPSPLQAPARIAEIPGQPGKTETVLPDPNGPFAAYVFKTLSDPFVGKISYFRVLRGTIANDGLFVSVKHPKPEKAHTQLIFGKDLKPVERLVPGDIGALPKIESLDYGDSFFAEGHAVQFARPEQPTPMASLAVEPKARGDEQKIGAALHKLAAEDPTFHVRREPQTHETILDGLSELHLLVMMQRLKRRFHVEVNSHLPRIPYKEAIVGKAEGHYRHKKQSGGRGQFGECYLRIEPLERGKGFEFVNDIHGGSIPRQFLPAIEKGVHEMLEKGVIAGCQVVDVRVSVHDGKFHEVDSDEISFKIAGARAFADAFVKARPALLEPIMHVEITIPAHFMGQISGDLNTRRGRIEGMDSQGDIQTIKAHAPLSELLQYGTQLRSITAGEGSFTMTFSHYDPVPHNIQEKVVAAYAATKPHAHAEE